MKLNYDEAQHILKDLPNFELSYETLAHKKVHDANIYLATPQGKKCIAWFSTYKDTDVCYLIELDTITNKFSNVEIIQTGFDFKLSFDTILQGYLFSWNGTRCFSVDDIYYFMGKNISNNRYSDKLTIINRLFSESICQLALNKNYVIFGLPLMSNNFSELIANIEQLPYKVTMIKCKYFYSKKSLFLNYYKPGENSGNNKNINSSANKQSFVFKITPDIQNDIYNLLVYKDGKEEFYDIAFIPDYKTSVMMNKLFRNIKENERLDSLEESDDEEEFENDKIDKFVFLDKSYKMVCEYNYKFNKWYPVSLANKNDRIVNEMVLRKSNK